ncbi:MAG: cysteine--tRNA ligase [Actinobacteria bacterium]|uniref:Cysteine--tRNA ligase n=1 Tax=freshwater metagenome TaxID=449393 RepID=A0A6J6JC53_9ZZZZ|nr:cysteine--tRNA ligase [Actinomycetota bacterium]MTA38500.1 cysteine--tRNA ligase [Actinomycetota bacterium]
MLKLYETRSREVLPIEGRDGILKVYCCGPTVYRDAHVGNLRTFLLADLISRAATVSGLKVTLIQNITDVGHMATDLEDKILAQSKSESLDPFVIARKYEDRFHVDLNRLNIQPANLYPRASENIPLMISAIEKLIADGFAYVATDGNVYFDAQSFPTYGAISGNRLDSLKPGHRYEYSEDGAKRFHADWALWKLARDRTEMIWPTPWGDGYPGWHIECSAMSIEYLGQKIDLHVGGIDLRFPHHENERAQSNALTGSEAITHWIHGEHLLFEGRKMSKSAGNVLLLQDIIDRGLDPLAARLAFLENRYRSQMDLTWASLEAAHVTLRRWRMLVQAGLPDAQVIADQDFLTAIYADLDTPRALQRLRVIEKNVALSPAEKAGIFRFADQILGLDLSRVPEKRELTERQSQLLKEREIARAAKDFAESDRLRSALEESGLEIQDGPQGQIWS